MTKTLAYDNVVKVSLKNLDKDVFEYMQEHFKSFTTLLDGSNMLYLKINSFIDKKNIDLSSLKTSIIGFACVSQDYLYNTLETIEVVQEFRNKNVSFTLLDNIMYDCKKKQKNLCLTKLTKNGKDYLVSSLEKLSVKYSLNVYSVEEMEDFA